jgi:hypothetical protein
LDGVEQELERAPLARGRDDFDRGQRVAPHRVAVLHAADRLYARADGEAVVQVHRHEPLGEEIQRLATRAGPLSLLGRGGIFRARW